MAIYLLALTSDCSIHFGCKTVKGLRFVLDPSIKFQVSENCGALSPRDKDLTAHEPESFTMEFAVYRFNLNYVQAQK